MNIGPNPTRGCIDEVRFHALLLSEIEFLQYLPTILQIQVLVEILCIRRTIGRCYRNSISNRSTAWKLTPSTHTQAVQKMWTLQNRYGYRYAKICIFPTMSLSNRRRLARLRDIWTSCRKRGVWCLTLLSCKVMSQGQWEMIFAIVSPATKEHNSVNCKFW